MRRREKQLEFGAPGFVKPKDAFGGALLKGNPKSKRPLDSKFPIFLTLRAQKSVLRLPRTYGTVQKAIANTAQKHGFRIYSQANVGNHLHMVMKIPSVPAWAAFIRELTGRIAQLIGEVMGVESELRFWKFRPHTRIVRSWRKAFQSVKDYIFLNQLEGEGHISRKETKTLKDLRMIWADG